MKKLFTTIACLLLFFTPASSQEIDTVVDTKFNKSTLFSNAQLWSVKTKPYIEKAVVLSDSELGKAIIKTKIKVNKDDISNLSYIGYYLSCNTVIDVKDNAYKISLESPSVLIDINTYMSLSRMNTKELLKYKEELELINDIVLDDRLLNNLIHWSIKDVYTKHNDISLELLELKSKNKPSKKKIAAVERKLDVINEILQIWKSYSSSLKDSIIDNMSKDNSF